jgi:hypothetical protein
MLEQYIKTLQNLKELGEKILNDYSESERVLEEIECLDVHLQCAINILG